MYTTRVMMTTCYCKTLKEVLKHFKWICNWWNLEVNHQKSQIIVFNPNELLILYFVFFTIYYICPWFCYEIPIKHTYIIETRSFSIHRVFNIYFPLEQRVIWYQYRLVFLSGLKGRRFSVSIWEWIFWGTTEHV